jgi:enterochelin esterase-like enzyme
MNIYKPWKFIGISLIVLNLSLLAIAQSKPCATIGEGSTWAKCSGEPADLMQVIMYESEVLNGGKHLYFLHLPPSYEKDKTRKYPVIYFLHGNATRLADANALVKKLLEAYKKGTIPEVIVVAPRGRSGSGWKDNPGDMKAETVTMKSLIPHIEKTYRVIQEREARALEGFSMGGGGALRFAFKFPEFFGAASSVGGAGGTDEDSATGYLKKNVDKIRGKVFVRVIVGDQDSLKGRSEAMHNLLTELKVDHTYTVIKNVGHTYVGAYENYPGDVLDFFRQAFKKYSTTQPGKNTTLTLKKGWNLFSLPLQTQDLSVKAVLSGIEGKFLAVHSYENSAYKSYIPGATDNKLEKLAPGNGYWIYMTSDASLNLSGTEATKSVDLNEGWNLVGLNSLSSLPVDTALSSIKDKYSAIYAFNSTTQSYNVPSSMDPGAGFWIHATQKTTWTTP